MGPSDQRRVWDEVSNYARRHKADVPTQSVAELDDIVADETNELGDVQSLPGQRGVIVAALGQPMVLELFDHPDTLSERLSIILRGFRLDVARLSFVETPSRRARRFAEQVTGNSLTPIDRDRTSQRLRSTKNQFVATETVFADEDLLHLSALNPRHELVLAV
jgi:hypothetical protein